MQLYGPRSSTNENKTCWVTGPSCTGCVIYPSVVVVAPLKPERIRLAKFNICGKASSSRKRAVATNLRHYQDLPTPVHIKTVNIKGEYKCIIMEHNDPIQVYWRKGYKAIYRLSLLLATACVDNIYLGFDRGCSQNLLLLVF